MQTTKYDVDLFQNQSRQLRNPTSATTATATATATATTHPINANILHRGGGRVLLRGFQHSLLLQVLFREHKLHLVPLRHRA